MHPYDRMLLAGLPEVGRKEVGVVDGTVGDLES